MCVFRIEKPGLEVFDRGSSKLRFVNTVLATSMVELT